MVSPGGRCRRWSLAWRSIYSESAATRTASSGKNMKDLLHVAVGGCCCLLRTAAALTRAQVGRVPVPPVVLGARRLVARASPTRAPREPPAVPVRILERGKREVGTPLRVAPAGARVLHGVVEG